MSAQPFVVKEFQTPKQLLEHRNDKTTTVFSSLSCRGSSSTISDEDKTMRHKNMSTPYKTEDRKQRVNEYEKQLLDDGSMDTKTRIKDEKSTLKSSYSADTMKIKFCESKQVKKKSEEPISCNEVLGCEGIKAVQAFSSQLSQNNTQNVRKESKKTNNCKKFIHYKNERNAPKTSTNAEIKRSSNSHDSTNQLCFPKKLVTVQIPKTCSSGPGQVTSQPTTTNQISSDKEKNLQQPNLRSPTCSAIIQGTIASEHNNNYSKPMVTPTSTASLAPTQTTSSSRVTTSTPITTGPVRSGLKLLSIVSTESSPNTRQIITSPTMKILPESSKITVKTPTTQNGLLITSLKIQKIANSSNSKVTTTPTIKVVAGSPKSTVTTPKTPTTVQLAISPNSSATSSTTDYPINSPRSPPTTPQKPSSYSLSNSLVTLLHTPNSSTPSLLSLSNSQTTTTPPFKENESPRTPLSEPAFKAWIPPLDTDPMSQTFLRMPFTYQSLQIQCKHGNRPHVKRPMNAFMVWAKKNRASIAKRFPNASNAEISVRLGHIWNELPSDEQKPYFDEANELKEKHKHENPNWVYQPRPGKKCRKALFQCTASKSQPTSPIARRIIAKAYERPIHPRSAPSSPTVKRPLWVSKKSELSEEELQSRIVEDLLEEEIQYKEGADEGTGNPTMDRYIDEWLSPKRTRRDETDLCLMSDAMLPAVNDDEQNILEEETRCDVKDFEKYIKQLKTEQNNFTKLENNISSLEEDDEMSMEDDG